MALPSSGQISISQIRTELGTSDGSLRNLSSLAGKSTPDAMSEFYGYSAAVTIYVEYSLPSSMGCYNNYVFTAAATANVNTNLTVYITWYGDLGGYISTSGIIYSGTSCVDIGIYTSGAINCWGENFSYASVSLSPSSSGNQTYVVGSQLPTGVSCI